MTKLLLALLVVVLYVLHQDIWFWRNARPLVFGFLPIGLFYHAIYTIAVSGLMWLMVRYAWPAYLERETEVHDPAVILLPETGEAPASAATGGSATSRSSGERGLGPASTK